MEIYDYSKLESFFEKAQKEVKAGQADELESKLYVAAGHALDLMDIVADADGDLKLDLTADTEEAVPMAVSLVHMVSLASGNTSVSEGKEYIVKKLAGYELFAIHNELLRVGHEAAFVVEGDTVKIKSVAADGGPFTFDVYGAMSEVIKEFILATDPGAGFVAFGTMQPFYDKLAKDFFEKLS